MYFHGIVSSLVLALILFTELVNGRSVWKFPSVKNPESVRVRLKNVAQQVYISVTIDNEGQRILSTKTRDLDNTSDLELEFTLYYYTSADASETKVVLPVHEATKTCFSFTSDRKLDIVSLKEADQETNEVEPVEDPTKFTKADSRFFYIKASGTNFALEAMNGKDTNYFLSITETNDVVIKESSSRDYPDDILFSLDLVQ